VPFLRYRRYFGSCWRRIEGSAVRAEIPHVARPRPRQLGHDVSSTHTAFALVAGAFGAARTRKAGPGARIFGGCGCARFGAGDGPAPRRVLRELTHFAAACGNLRRRTSAITCGDRGVTNFAGRVGPHGEAEKCGGQQEIEADPDGDAPNACKQARGSSHGVSFRRLRKKTDSAGLPKWGITRVVVRPEPFARRLVPFLTGQAEMVRVE